MKLTYSQYCHNRTMKQSASYTKGFYYLGNQKFTQEQLDNKYPTEGVVLINANDKKTGKGLNADKRNLFIMGQKCY